MHTVTESTQTKNEAIPLKKSIAKTSEATSSKVSSAHPIEESLKIATPAWPLQNTVAVNPFWFLRNKPFEEALEDITPALRTSLFMPLEYYRERLRDGDIMSVALQEALEEARSQDPSLPKDLDTLLQTSAGKDANDPMLRGWKSFSECFEEERNWNTTIVAEVGKYASAFLDDRQALSRFPWQGETFWNGWLEAQRHDPTMEEAGAMGFAQSVALLRGLTPEIAIAFMLEGMEVTDQTCQIAYMRRLMATVLGWSTQFKYLEWQRQLGYTVERSASSVELLAVRMAYDFGLFQIAQNQYNAATEAWRNSLETGKKERPEAKATIHAYRLHAVFQLALELSYQKRITAKIASNVASRTRTPKAQMAFCIDVRSEMLRRHIEDEDDTIQTIGFAGFFGVPFDYHRLGEKGAGHRLPVLLTPAFEVKESPLAGHQKDADRKLGSDLTTSYFRNLRKNPLSSFLYVELFGALYIQKMLRRSWETLTRHWHGPQIPERFDPAGMGPNQKGVMAAGGKAFDDAQRIERAAVVLQHMGLAGSKFGELVYIVGHGSETTNNAFGSSLDCGACGGHAGDINARFLADLLNDPVVRKGLAEKGMSIPSTTWFVAGVHETVTDEVFVLDSEKVPASHHLLLAELERTLKKAAVSTRRERQGARSSVLDSSAERRSQNWSEVRPEWGLAGNACFIVAPRERTKGVNLSSRSFLHDYDWKKDQANGFKTLELIMTAPMVVTNWINLQYYASTVAPQVYGSGNKILHNLTNEVGVVEGNGGDLRVGLPIQSVHDGNRFVHEPLRLSVMIEAPREEIENIIAKHEVVRQLVDRGWLHLIHIEPSSSRIMRRLAGGTYMTV